MVEKLSVGVAGTGRAARFLVRFCAHHGVPVVGVWGRRSSQVAGLGQVYSSLPALLVDSSLVFLAVSDAALTAVVAQARPPGGRAYSNLAVAHLSGYLSDACLAPLAAAGAVCGSLHPLMTLNELCPLTGIHFFAQSGDRRFATLLQPFVETTGNQWHELSGPAKTTYHTAATMLCQGIAAACESARTILGEAGLSDQVAAEALYPLAEATLAARLQSPAAMTGPAVRGDEATVDAHRQALAGSDHLEFYDAITAAVRRLNPQRKTNHGQ